MTDEKPDNGRSASAGTPPPLPPPALDTRRHAVRPDLAALSLRGQVDAPRYATGIVRQVARPAVPLRREPNPTLGLENEILYGELVKVYDEAEGWAWVQLERDRYVGYVPSVALTAEIMPPTHRVNALGTFIYPAPDIKTPPVMHLPLNADVRVAEWSERFCRLERGGFVVTRHLNEHARFERDFVDIAERMIGSPYLWGGRTRIGIDCSGLVQVALEAAGIPAPRDTDMQVAELGHPIAIPQELDGLQRGDLVFWKGHVGIMSDALMLVHANAYHMAVAAETLPEAADRIDKQASSAIVAIRRLSPSPGARLESVHPDSSA
jgi:cell wall-associated NlpC family hydrolase